MTATDPAHDTAPGHAWRIPLLRPSLPSLDAYAALLEDVWSSGTLSNEGPQARRFEASIAAYSGAGHVVATANCDLALTLAVRAFDLPRGTAALVPSFTFASTLNALLWNGLAPRFVDVDPHTFCLDPAAVAEAVTSEVGLIVGTHAYGVACDAPALAEHAGSVGARLLFDGAQAIGTFADGAHTGTYGDATAVSFSATKLATSGEGGAILTADAALASRLRTLRAYGRDGRHEAGAELGLNAKLSELHAALGTLALAQVEEAVERRAELVARYAANLDGLQGVRLQSAPDGQRPGLTFLAVDLGPHRHAAEAALTAADIQTRRYFRPLHTVDAFATIPRSALPVTEHLAGAVLCLPLFPGLTEGEVDEVCATVREAVQRSAAA